MEVSSIVEARESAAHKMYDQAQGFEVEESAAQTETDHQESDLSHHGRFDHWTSGWSDQGSWRRRMAQPELDIVN